MNQLFQDINLNAAFTVAVEIINTISSENSFDKLDEILYLQAKSCDDLMIEILNNNISQVVSPQKKTLLHSFIKTFYEIYINNDFYNFKDMFFDEPDSDILSDYIETKRQLFDDCKLNITKYLNESEQLCKELNYEYEKDEPDTFEVEKRIKDLLIRMEEELTINTEYITESVFYLLYSNKKILFDFNFLISKYVKTDILPI